MLPVISEPPDVAIWLEITLAETRIDDVSPLLFNPKSLT